MNCFTSEKLAPALLTVAILACGTSSDGAGGGGGEGARVPTDVQCPPGYTVMVVPAVLEAGSCVATDEQVELQVCVTPDPELFSLRCHEREVDGARFWFVPSRRIALAEGFVECGAPFSRSCEFEECAESGGFLREEPLSLCAAQDTIDAFDCGGEMSAYDENCCARRFCDESPCEVGFTCRAVPVGSRMASPFNNGEETFACAVHDDVAVEAVDADVCFPE